MSDVGGSVPITGVFLTLDDFGPQLEFTLTPARINLQCWNESICGRRLPPSRRSSALAIFNGTNPNGTGRFTSRTEPGEQRQFRGGWELNTAPPMVRTTDPTPTATKAQGITPTPSATISPPPTTPPPASPTPTATPTTTPDVMDLALTKTTRRPARGHNLTYTITITTSVTPAALNVQMSDTLPAG